MRERADALQASTARPASTPVTESHAVGQAYKLLGELIGGVVVGLALGAAFDWFAKTAPWGMIVGILSGFALSIWMAKRTADRLTAMAKRESAGAQPAAALDDDEDEER